MKGGQCFAKHSVAQVPTQEAQTGGEQDAAGDQAGGAEGEAEQGTEKQTDHLKRANSTNQYLAKGCGDMNVRRFRLARFRSGIDKRWFG